MKKISKDDGAGVWSQKTRQYTEPRNAPVKRNRMAMTNAFHMTDTKKPRVGQRLPSILITADGKNEFASTGNQFHKHRFGSGSPNKMAQTGFDKFNLPVQTALQERLPTLNKTQRHQVSIEHLSDMLETGSQGHGRPPPTFLDHTGSVQRLPESQSIASIGKSDDEYEQEFDAAGFNSCPINETFNVLTSNSTRKIENSTNNTKFLGRTFMVGAPEKMKSETKARKMFNSSRSPIQAPVLTKRQSIKNAYFPQLNRMYATTQQNFPTPIPDSIVNKHSDSATISGVITNVTDTQLYKLRFKDLIQDDRETRQQFQKTGLAETRRNIKKSMYQMQKVLGNHFSLLDEIKVGQGRAIDLVGGIPFQVKLDFGNWRKPIKVMIKYIGDIKKANLTVKGSFKDGSHSVEVNGQPEKVQIMPPVNKTKPEDVLFYIHFESSAGISFVVQPVFDSSGFMSEQLLEKDKGKLKQPMYEWHLKKFKKQKDRGEEIQVENRHNVDVKDFKAHQQQKRNSIQQKKQQKEQTALDKANQIKEEHRLKTLEKNLKWTDFRNRRDALIIKYITNKEDRKKSRCFQSHIMLVRYLAKLAEKKMWVRRRRLMARHILMFTIRASRSFKTRTIDMRHKQYIKMAINWKYSYHQQKQENALEEVLKPFLVDRVAHYRFIFLIVNYNMAVSRIQSKARHMIKLKQMRLNILHNKLVEEFYIYRDECDKSRDRLDQEIGRTLTFFNWDMASKVMEQYLHVCIWRSQIQMLKYQLTLPGYYTYYKQQELKNGFNQSKNKRRKKLEQTQKYIFKQQKYPRGDISLVRIDPQTTEKYNREERDKYIPELKKIKLIDYLDFNLKNRINNIYEIGIVDPNEEHKSCEKSLKRLHADVISDYSTILDMQYQEEELPEGEEPEYNSDDDVESLLLLEPTTVFIPSRKVIQQIIKAVRVYGQLTKEELFARFSF